MTGALTDAIVHGIGVAISPLVIIVLIMILLSPRARSNGTAFLMGWLFALMALGAIVLTRSGLGGSDGFGGQVKPHGMIDISLGILLLTLTFAGLIHRNKKHTNANVLSAANNFTLLQAAAAGFFFAAIYPKNLILATATASELAILNGYIKFELYLLFVAIASVPVAGPVLTCIWGGERIRPFLGQAKVWLGAHGHSILILVLVFFGLKLVVQGVISLVSR